MSILVLTIPISITLVIFFVLAYLSAVKDEQFDDLETPEANFYRFIARLTRSFIESEKEIIDELIQGETIERIEFVNMAWVARAENRLNNLTKPSAS